MAHGNDADGLDDLIISPRNLAEFMAWYDDTYTPDLTKDDIYINCSGEEQEYTREEVVREFIDKFNLK